MKKRILSMLLCCLMLFGLVFTVSADPDQPEVDPVAHAITVTTENGTATASAETAFAGTEITLTAEANEGFRFKEWQVIKGGIEITDNKFVMPDEDVEVKAIFEAIPEVIPEEHSITIIPVGKGKTYSVPKTAVAGTEITLHAEPDSGWIFYGWEEVVEEGVDKVTIASDKFIMPDRDVVIRVIFVKESSIKVTTDGNGTASADKEKALNGEEITLTATPKEGYAFKEWQVIKGNVEIKDNKFIMPDEDVEVKAIFAAEHKIVVLTDKNGTASASATDAIAGTEIEGMSEVLEGTTALAVSHEDQIAPARILNKFAKDSDGKFVIKSGYMDGKVMSPAEIAAIADLPSKEGLVQMLLSVLVSGPRGLAIALSEVAKAQETA